MKQNQETRVKDIITKFFYRDNQLCFQILIRGENGETLPFKEFLDFAEYKRNFVALQKVKSQGGIFNLSGESVLVDLAVAKVA